MSEIGVTLTEILGDRQHHHDDHDIHHREHILERLEFDYGVTPTMLIQAITTRRRKPAHYEAINDGIIAMFMEGDYPMLDILGSIVERYVNEEQMYRQNGNWHISADVRRFAATLSPETVSLLSSEVNIL